MDTKKTNVQFVPKETMNSKALYFYRSTKGTFKISDAAVSMLLQYSQIETSAPESGGVLIGRNIIESEDIVVDDISHPTKNDIRSRFRFFRDKLFHQSIINKIWNDSQGRINYLGEWHTHPEPNPTPSSSIDIVGWKKRLKHDKVDSESVFFVIVGTKKINVWEGRRLDQKITKLKLWQQKN